MKHLTTILVFLIVSSTILSAQNKVYVLTYNPFNTQEDIGYIEEYEDDLQKSIEILKHINQSTSELNTEGNILYLTVLYQNSLDRSIDQQFEKSMAYVTQEVSDCIKGSQCALFKSILTKSINELEGKLKHLNNPKGKRQDMTFFKEYHRSGKKVLSRIYDEVQMLSISNGEEFKTAYLSIEPESSVMIMDHAGSRIFGMRSNKFIEVLAQNPPKELLLGICRSYLVVDDIKLNIPSTTLIYTEADKWKGFDSRKTGIEGIFPESFRIR